MKKSDAEVSDLDIAELLDSEEAVRLFLEEALAEYDLVLWQRCLVHAVQSAGMAKIIEKNGFNREELCKTLKEDGYLRFDTVMRVPRFDWCFVLPLAYLQGYAHGRSDR